MLHGFESADSRRPVHEGGTEIAQRVIALVGNPNTGKTSLFNALTGFTRHVANYPGVTVDVAAGPIRGLAQPAQLVDLPGTYSLAASSPDEAIVTETLCGQSTLQRVPDCIVAIVDASNLHRNFYLISQLIELGLPLVVAVNMVDVAARRGIAVDTAALSRKLGVPVVGVTATRSATVAALRDALEQLPDRPPPGKRPDLPEALMREARQLVALDTAAMHPAEAVRVLLYPGGHAEQAYFAAGGQAEVLHAARERLKEGGIDSPAVEVRARYAWINEVLSGALTRPDKPVETWSDRFDQLLTHRVSGGITLAIVLFTVFWAIFSGAAPLMDAIDAAFAWLGAFVASWLPAGVIRSLIVDGVIAGVGGVVIFLPQILVLFLAIAVLEDCGYLSRAAYMMDRLMRGVGLSGRAFIPLLSSFACAVPAIMGTRAISDRRERLITIMLAPFMSCSARLPVYALMIAAFVPPIWLGGWLPLQPLVMLGMYMVGIVVAIPVAWGLKHTLFAGPPTSFVLELPTYKLPRPRAIWQRMSLAGREFLMRAGTIILVVNLVVWALAYFPHSDATREAVMQDATAAGWDEEQTAHALDAAYLRQSYLGQMGQAIEPAIDPIGWDWKIGVGVIASFPAREVIVATLSTLFQLGDDAEGASLRQALRAARTDDGSRQLFTLPVALSIMVFFALCAQCGATLAVIRKETGSWGYPVLSFAMMTGIAYLAAWGTAVGARAIGL